MAPRVVHNFSGHRAVILTAAAGSVEVLESTLRKLGLSVQCPPNSDGRSTLDISSLQSQDILFVDGDMNGMIDAAQLRAAAVPIVGLIGVEAPSRLKTFVNLGATAFIRKPIYAGIVYSALYLGVNQFLQRRDLELQLEDHQNRRRRRRVVVKAILELMKQTGMDDDEAYARLRQDSMRQRRSLEDYCEDYVGALPAATDELPRKKISLGA